MKLINKFIIFQYKNSSILLTFQTYVLKGTPHKVLIITLLPKYLQILTNVFI